VTTQELKHRIKKRELGQSRFYQIHGDQRIENSEVYQFFLLQIVNPKVDQ